MSKKWVYSSARAVALAALYRVDHHGAYVNLALSELLSQSSLDARDRAFATELAYGTLRWRGKIDWVLSHFVRRSLASQHPLVRNILRLSTYQLLFLKNIPAPVIGNEAVLLTKSNPATRHAASFVNALVHKVAKEGTHLEHPPFDQDPISAIAVSTSHPEWMVKRWTSQYGVHQVRAFMEANNEPAPLAARVNPLRTTVQELLTRLKEEGVSARQSGLLTTAIRIDGAPGLGNLASFQDGWFTAQDEGSQLVSHVVDPQPDHVVWDVCSAPGTKTTHLAELTDDRAQILAADIHAGRSELVQEACERLGIRSVKVTVADARTPVGDALSADRVLIDAPCSGVGVLRRRPDLRWNRSEDDFAELIQLQRQILQGSSELVRPGGVLVYSTCSVDFEENVGNIRWFIEQHPQFVPSSLESVLPESLFEVLSADRQKAARSGYIQLWPHLDGTDGFFIARFVRQKL